MVYFYALMVRLSQLWKVFVSVFCIFGARVIILFLSVVSSSAINGVTRVGVTRCSN